MAPNVLNIGTVMAQGHHFPLGTKLPPIWHLLGTIRAPCWHKKNYLLLSGTFLAPILFHYVNHQSQACSCNRRYSLTGEVFLVKALQAWLGPDCQTVCDYFYVKQLDNHWALWREAWCEEIQLIKIWECPLSYIQTIAREFFHSWGVMTGARAHTVDTKIPTPPWHKRIFVWNIWWYAGGICHKVEMEGWNWKTGYKKLLYIKMGFFDSSFFQKKKIVTCFSMWFYLP